MSENITWVKYLGKKERVPVDFPIGSAVIGRGKIKHTIWMEPGQPLAMRTEDAQALVKLDSRNFDFAGIEDIPQEEPQQSAEAQAEPEIETAPESTEPAPKRRGRKSKAE